MANNKSGTIVAVSVISLLLVGTAIYFVVKGAKTKPKPQEGGGGDGGRLPVGGGQSEPSLPVEQTPQPTKTGFGAFLESLTRGFQKGLTTKDPSTYQGFSFPIKRGQKGSNVKRLQQLLLTFDKNILPRFGADGDFGTETETALVRVIGKKQVNSQDDILAIETKIKEKAGSIMAGAFMNQQLGIKLY
jgi:hypothetical protein